MSCVPEFLLAHRPQAIRTRPQGSRFAKSVRHLHVIRLDYDIPFLCGWRMLAFRDLEIPGKKQI